jgi:hypothetical protein
MKIYELALISFISSGIFLLTAINAQEKYIIGIDKQTMANGRNFFTSSVCFYNPIDRS